MKKRLQFQKSDWLAVALICLLAAAVFCLMPMLRSGSTYAQIYRDGKLVREVPLSVNQTFRIRGDYTNTVTVVDGKIAVTHSDCPNQDCVYMGWLKDGGNIVCLPNRMEIRLGGDTAVDAVVR